MSKIVSNLRSTTRYQIKNEGDFSVTIDKEDASREFSSWESIEV